MNTTNTCARKKVQFPEILTVLQARVEMAVYLQANTKDGELKLSIEKKVIKNKLDSSLSQRHDTDFLTPNEMGLLEELCG